jgi:prepilin-type processing-associated H-X9-DG protein
LEFGAPTAWPPSPDDSREILPLLAVPSTTQETPLLLKHRRCAAFTFKELIVVLVLVPVLLVLTGLLLPPRTKAKKKAQRINCVNNLKQIGTGFRLWAIEFGGTNELHPTQISTNSGGAMELLVRQEVWPVFQVMSNELNTPKILICPADVRQVAPDFARLRNTNLSYFVSRDARQDSPGSLLTGDRNLEVAGRPVPAGRLTLTTNQATGWTTNQHNHAGNVGLADGSVQQVSNARFQVFLISQQVATNRLVIP